MMTHNELIADLSMPLSGSNVVAFALAGHATMTVESVATGARFTYRITAKEGRGLHFVSVLTGPDNTRNYAFIGTIVYGLTFRHSPKSTLSAEASAVKAWSWFWSKAAINALPGPDVVRVYHMGACGRCGRPLTTPESIRTGLGPVCAEKGNA